MSLRKSEYEWIRENENPVEKAANELSPKNFAKLLDDINHIKDEYDLDEI